MNENKQLTSQPKDDINEAWQRNLPWPKASGQEKTKKKVKEELPFALTGAQWRNIQLQLKEEKLKKELEVKKKAQERLMKKKEEELGKASAKIERENKKEERLRMKDENEAKKLLAREERLKKAKGEKGPKGYCDREWKKSQKKNKICPERV